MPGVNFLFCSYVPARALTETPDPGAVAVGIWMGAVAEALAE